jgi:hypothetical protein
LGETSRRIDRARHPTVSIGRDIPTQRPQQCRLVEREKPQKIQKYKNKNTKIQKMQKIQKIQHTKKGGVDMGALSLCGHVKATNKTIKEDVRENKTGRKKQATRTQLSAQLA